MAFLDDVQVAGAKPAPVAGATGGAGTSFLGDLSVGPATGAPKAASTPVASTSTPSIPPISAKPTSNLFSGFMSFAGNALGKASDAISKATTAPTQAELQAGPGGGKNSTINTLRYLPSELARSIPGVSELQDDPNVTQYMDAQDLPKNVATAVGQTAVGLAKAPITAVADIYDAGREVLGKNPNASFNTPVLGKVTSNEFNVVQRIQNGEDPLAATLDEGAQSIFNTLFFADVVNRVAGPRAIKTAEVNGNVEDTGLTPTPGPKTGRLYESPTAYSKGGAQVLPDAVLTKMKAQGVELGPKFDPKMPTFFRVIQDGAKYKGEVMQLRPSYMQTAFEKVFGTKGGPTSVPEMLGIPNANGNGLAKIADDAKPGDVTTLHSETIDPNDIKDSINTEIKKMKEPTAVASTPTEPTAAPALGVSMAQTVAHNVLRLGGGDTSLAAEGGKVLQSDIKSHVKTHGEIVTHQALQDKLGVDGETAARLVAEARPTPKIVAPPKPSAFLTDTEVAHGVAEGVNLKQPTKLSNEEAAPIAVQAADTHWRDIQEPAIKAGKPIVIGADDLKDHFGKDYNDNNHPVYSRAAFLEYEHALTVAPVKEVVFTGGGPASGKTELVTKDLVNRGFKGIVYDSNMANYEGIKKQIEMARAAGFKVVIRGVLPNLESARTFSILRGNEIGRHISDATFARGHAGFPNVAHKLMEEGIISEHDMHILDTRGDIGFQEAMSMVKNEGYVKEPLAILRKLDYNEENFKQLYGKDKFDATTGQRLDALSGSGGAGEAPGESGADQENANAEGDEGVLGLTAEQEVDWEKNYSQKIGELFDQSQKLQQEIKDAKVAEKPALIKELAAVNAEAAKLENDFLAKWQPKVSSHSTYTVPQPMRGFIDPFAIADDVTNAVKEVKDYIDESNHTTELTGNVNDAIYKLEGARKANRQRAIQLLQERGNDLTAEEWEHLYHYDEAGINQYVKNPKTGVYEYVDVPLTPKEQKVYNEVIAPIKEAFTAARAEYRNLGGHITTDLGQEMTPRYAKEKGGPIDKILGQVKEVAKGAKTLYNGGLLSKSVGSGAKHRIFYALTDSKGQRTVASIPNAKASRVTTFKNGTLTDIGPKSGREGDTFTDENGNTYLIDQATTKEIEAHTKTRYHKNVLANYVLAYDRTSTSLSALKLLDRLQKTPEFADLIYKENEEEAPPAKWQDLSGVLPQFRGYYAEPKLWEALKDLSTRLKGREPFPVLDEINNFLTSMIVLNPIMHFPNVAMGWASAEAGTGEVPGLTSRSRANFARAVNEVKNKGPLYLTYLEHGAPFMAIKGTAHDFTKAVLDQYSAEVAENPSEHAALAKALGYANPVAWMKGLNKLNENITWGGNDIMFMHALLDHADKTGVTPSEAIKEISKRMADYRLPSRLGPGKFGRAVSLTLQSRGFLFSRFHYSGVLKPWVETLKDTAAPGSSGAQRLAGARVFAYLGLMALVAYPFINKMLQGITGDKKTYISDAGATKVVQNVGKLAQAGVSGIPAFGQSTATLSPAVTAAIELGFNVDLYTRNPIYGNPPAQGMSQFGISMIAPLSSGSRMTASDFALSLLGIYTPKNAPGKNALDAQKYDELPALQVQVKKLIVEGQQDKADALMKDFNDRAIANYNANALATGAKPLAADGSENEAFLKQWGIASPGQVALDNAAALYGDGSLTAKSSLIDNVVLYAKAVGTDPATAFERIFTGQRIVRVTGGPFNPDSSILVERMPLAASEAVKTGRGATSGQVLDHVIPLEAGGSNDTSNLNLIPAANNVGEQHTFENMLGDAVKAGVITPAQVREYSIRYKVGQGETLPQGYMDEYASTYGSKPLTLDEVHQLILDNEPNKSTKK